MVGGSYRHIEICTFSEVVDVPIFTIVSVRPEIAASLQSIQSQLGDSLGGVLEEQATAPTPNYRQALVLEHIGGLQSGGSMPLTIGSYRFGRSSNSIMLDTGKPHDPQFGLTIDPEGEVVLYPPSAGVLLDGVMITEPEPMKIGQVITVGHNRFGLKPQARLSVSRTSTAGEAGDPMPTPGKGKAVDQAIIDWVAAHRDRSLRSLWSGLVSPVEIHNRITQNELFTMTAQDPGFGRGLLGTTDLGYDIPLEVATANRATRDHAAGVFSALAGAPLCVDFTKTSLAIVGPLDQARAIATWLVLSLAVQSSPADLGIIAKTSASTGSWSWLDRLPHVAATTPTLPLAIIDEPYLGPAPAAGAIVLFESAGSVTEGFGMILEVSANSATYIDQNSGPHERSVAAIGLADAVAVERSLVISQHVENSEGESWA